MTNIVIRPHELFNWLFAVDDAEKTDLWDGGLLVWHIKYQHANSDLLDDDVSNMTKSSRLKHRLDIKKDDVQMVLPISKVSRSASRIFMIFHHPDSIGIMQPNFLEATQILHLLIIDTLPLSDTLLDHYEQ